MYESLARETNSKDTWVHPDPLNEVSFEWLLQSQGVVIYMSLCRSVCNRDQN